MSMLTLSDLAATVGENEGINFTKGKTREEGAKFESPFQIGLAYPITITEQNVTTTRNDYLQAELKVAIGHGGNLRNAGKIWVNLPIFSEAKTQAEDPTRLNELRQFFGEKLHGLLRAVDGATFNIYDKMEKNGKKWTYFNADGSELTGKAKVAREKEMGRAVVGAAHKMYSGEYSLAGKEVFYVRTQDSKNPNKFYDQFYSTVPNKYPLASL